MTTRSRIAAMLLALCAGVLTLAACSGNDPDLELTISTDGSETTLQAAEGASATVDMMSDKLTITVDSVDGEKVVISTSEAMAPRNPSGGINLNDLRSTFPVTLDEPAKFATATMDAGQSYEVTLHRK